MWISACIKSLIDFLSKFVDYKTVKTEHQTTTEIVREKKSLKKAADITERLIENSECFFRFSAKIYYDELNFRQKRQFKHFYKTHLKLKKQFLKVN